MSLIPLAKTFSTLILILLAAAGANRGYAAVITVGSGAGCDVSSLEAALILASSTPGPDEIRLSYGESYTGVALTITDFGNGLRGGLSIVGGFGGCADETPMATPVVISGLPDAPVFTINTATSDSLVTFRNVSLTGSGGDGLRISGNAVVTFDNARSLGHAGSGVHVSGGARLDLVNASRIENNTTTGFGGGIFCQGAEVHIVAGSIQNNVANSGGGGGVYASNCFLSVGKDGFIAANSAIDGGGIYADRGSRVSIQGAKDGQPALNINSALDDGGALYAKGAGTSVFFNNVRVEGNTAVRRGGGLFVDDEAVLLMTTSERSCRRPISAPGTRDDCSTLLRNSLGPGGTGVAVYAGLGATVVLARSYLERNSGGDSLIYVEGTGTEVYLEGLSIWSNAVAFLQDVRGSGYLSSAFVSSAHNRREVSGSMVDADVITVSGAVAELFSSVHQGGSFLGTAGLSGRCVMASISTPLVAGIDFFSLISDPGFIDSAGGNLSLREDSPAVDYCDDSGYQATYTDIDLEERGVDLPTNPDGSPGVPDGRFDLGFDELTDRLFTDRFE